MNELNSQYEINMSTGLPENDSAVRLSDPLTQPTPPTPPKRFRAPYKPTRTADRNVLLLAEALAVFCFLLWDCLLWASRLGLGEAVALVGIPVSAALWLRREGKQRTAYGTACWLLCVFGAVSLAFSADNDLKELTLWGLIPLFLLYVIERTGLRTGEGLRCRIHDFFSALFSVALGRLPEGCAVIFRSTGDEARRRRMRAVLLGLLCAIGALIVLVPLLVGSDAAFEGLVGKIDFSTALRGVLAAVFGAVTALLLFTLLFTSDVPGPTMTGKGSIGLEPAAVITFLAVIGGVYVLYLAAQFAYFTDAFRGLLPEDYTVAQYARRGFFEMCWIVAINLGLIVFSTRLCRKPGGKLPGAVKGLALFLCIFSLALVATALSKMGLYMNALGLTRLRVLTSVFMVFLALVIAAVGIKLFAERVPVLQFAVVTGAAILILLSLANVDGLVARYNVDAWRSGKLDGLDVKTICELGDGAVPALAELLDAPDPEIAEKAQEELRDRLVAHGLAKRTYSNNQLPAILQPVDDPGDLRSWNLVSRQARAVLLENRERLL